MSLLTTDKNWNRYVAQAERIARSEGFRDLRDRILDLAELRDGMDVIDLGAGTGLLTLPAAAQARRVWAVDVSPAMSEYLDTKARSADLTNVETVTSSIVSLPLVDCSADLAVSNYCFHHLTDADKLVALDEVCRVLRPGGRLVVGDMMFSATALDDRSRAVVASKVRALARKGPGGIWRLAKNGARLATGRWERPARPDWWREALRTSGFVEVEVETLEHEGGIASARLP